MTDDIVTRLRDNCACSGTEQFGYTCTSCTAADEIERLRAELERWKTCEMVTETVCGWDSEKTHCDVCKRVKKGGESK